MDSQKESTFHSVHNVFLFDRQFIQKDSCTCCFTVLPNSKFSTPTSPLRYSFFRSYTVSVVRPGFLSYASINFFVSERRASFLTETIMIRTSNGVKHRDAVRRKFIKRLGINIFSMPLVLKRSVYCALTLRRDDFTIL